MELFTLLGDLIDEVIWFEGCDKVVGDDYVSITIPCQSYEKVARWSESLLEVDDYVENDDYDYITINFDRNDNYRIDNVIFGKEVHRVKECVNRFAEDYNVDDLYLMMCCKIVCE